jgi:type IV pilus assembly protein PilW
VIYNGASCALESIAGVSGIPASIALAGAGTLPTQAVSGADLSCLGAWNEVTYSINNGNLYRTSNGGTPVPVIAGIVNIQAQYGISSAPNSNTIIQWVDASGSTWGTPSTTDRNRIKALRVAIVARNSLLEKDNVTDPCNSNTADASSLTGLCAWSATSLSPQNPSPAPWIYLSNDADGTSWQRYRYRVFETVIPLRNMIWSRSTL